VAYFSRAITNRRIESATTSAGKADTLGRAAAQIIVADIRSEIAGGSSITQPAGQMPIYAPLDPQKMIPSPVLAPSVSGNPVFNNLVKQSVGRFFPNTYTQTPIILSTTGRNTTISSANNRNVSLARWNYPVLNT